MSLTDIGTMDITILRLIFNPGVSELLRFHPENTIASYGDRDHILEAIFVGVGMEKGQIFKKAHDRKCKRRY